MTVEGERAARENRVKYNTFSNIHRACRRESDCIRGMNRNEEVLDEFVSDMD